MFSSHTHHSPYLLPDRLADVLAALQIMAAAERPERKIVDWANELDRNRDSETFERWKGVFEGHREFFLVYKLAGEDDLKAALRWRYVNKLYNSQTGQEYSVEQKQQLPEKQQWALTTKPLSVEATTALMNKAVDLHTRAIEELTARKWWIPVVVAVIGAVVTLLVGAVTLAGNAYVSYLQSQHQFGLSFAQKNAELAIQILQRDPNQITPELREWALVVLKGTPNIPVRDPGYVFFGRK